MGPEVSIVGLIIYVSSLLPVAITTAIPMDIPVPTVTVCPTAITEATPAAKAIALSTEIASPNEVPKELPVAMLYASPAADTIELPMDIANDSAVD